MSDSVRLTANGKDLGEVKRYEVRSDLFSASDSFSLDFAGRDIRKGSISPGDQIKLYVNDTLELNGIAEDEEGNYSKSGASRMWHGRDLMCLIVDHHIENGKTYENKTITQLATSLLQDNGVPYIKSSNIQAGEGGKAQLRNKAFSTTIPLVQVEPGDTIFAVLAKHAKQLGLLFYGAANGDMVFTPPVGDDRPLFELIHRKDEGSTDNNIIRCDTWRWGGISAQYSKVVVKGQIPGEDWGDDINVSGSVDNDNVPFKKVYAEGGYDGSTPTKRAKILRAEHIHEAHEISYTVQGHAQRGRNWQVNALVHVIDEEIAGGIDETLLITSRTFSAAKDQGHITQLTLTKPEAVR